MTFLSLRRAFVAGSFLVLAASFTAAQESKPATPAAAPTGDPITMKHVAPEVGMVESASTAADTDLLITVSVDGAEGPQIDSKRKESTKVTRKVLAVAEGRVTKCEIKYTESHVEGSSPQGEMSEDGPAVGKVAILEEKADGVTITDAEGKPLAEDVQQDVMDREVRGKKIRQHSRVLSAFLAKKGTKIGETITLPEDVASEAFGGAVRANAKITVTMTLKEKTTVDGAAAYAWDTAITRSGKANESMNVETSLKGVATFMADTGRFASFKGEGPIKLNGGGEQGGQQFDLDGEGTVKATMTNSVEATKPAEAPKK